MLEPRLTIIMPVYNERSTVLEILRRVRELPIDKEIIIVDNCSTDGTRELIKNIPHSDVRIILQQRNMMKGNSVKRGIEQAQGQYVVVQDGDLEYDPHDLVEMLTIIRREDALGVFGSRILGAKVSGKPLPRSVHRVGAGFINWIFHLLIQSSLTDVASCYKMAGRITLQNMHLHCDGFDLDYEIAAKLQLMARKQGKKIVELPISYAPRTVAEGKKINWRDGLHALATLCRCRWSTP
jgi:glycosyltransferase involved in cell wall biosynthesis